MPEQKFIVYIIDDDSSVLRGLRRLVDAYGYDARGFASAGEFLATGLPGDNSCLIIDVAMPEMDGLQLQEELVRRACKAPVIFITARNDPDIRERAKRAGGVGFFQKPVDAGALLDVIKWALTAGSKESLS
jgi:FixJ family two-component response regulator